MKDRLIQQLELWIEGWAALIDGLCRIITLGAWDPGLIWTSIKWAVLRQLARGKKKGEVANEMEER